MNVKNEPKIRVSCYIPADVLDGLSTSAVIRELIGKLLRRETHPQWMRIPIKMEKKRTTFLIRQSVYKRFKEKFKDVSWTDAIFTALKLYY